MLLAAFSCSPPARWAAISRAERGRLERRGARRGQLARAQPPPRRPCRAAAGVVAGAAVALAVTWLRARAADLDAGALVAHALLTPRALPRPPSRWAVATVLLSAGASSADARRAARRRRRAGRRCRRRGRAWPAAG